MTAKRRSIPTTRAQIAANKQNAQKSTGPKTAEGKDRVRWNCLQHGLLSTAALVTRGDQPEGAEPLISLIQVLRAQYLPHGVIEEMLVERIATSYWRLRRCHEAEVGEITLQSGNALADRKAEREKALYQSFTGEVSTLKPFWLFRETEVGLAKLIEMLKLAENELIEQGEIGETTECIIRKWFDGTDLPQSLFEQGKTKAQKLRLLRRNVLPPFEERRQNQEDVERLGDHAFLKASRVPTGIRADLLQRYESMIERQLYRAIRELERLQGIRLGNSEFPNKPTLPP